MKFATGKGHPAQEIYVLERTKIIRHQSNHKCQLLLGLHNVSGTDWGDKFVGIVINKKAWIDAYLKLGDDDQAISCFKEPGEHAAFM